MESVLIWIFETTSNILSIPITIFEYQFTFWEVIIFMFILYIAARIIFGIIGGD